MRLPAVTLEHMNSRWLARLTFSFFIVGTFLSWEGYKGANGELGPISKYRILLYFFASMLCYVMGVMGLRQRHRPQQPPEDPPSSNI
jgi:hypothetical protein